LFRFVRALELAIMIQVGRCITGCLVSGGVNANWSVWTGIRPTIGVYFARIGST